MKGNAQDADKLCAAPPPNWRAVLLVGHEPGLIKERGAALIKAWTGGDALSLVELPLARLKDDPGLLGYELHAVSLMGGERLVLIPDAGDSLTKMLKEQLADFPQTSARLLVYGQGLTSKSSLKTLFEAGDNSFVAFACYADEAGQSARLVRETLTAAGVSAPPPVLEALALSLSGDRLLLRRALEKLLLYIHPAETVTLADIAAVLPEAALDAEEEEMLRWLDGDALAAVEVASVKQAELIGRLRLVLRLILRLYTARAHMDAGLPAKQALFKLTPPVFFKSEALYLRVLQVVTTQGLERWIARLLDVERLAKRDGGLALRRWQRLVAP